MRNLFLNLLPYLISVLAGLLIYLLTDIYIKDEGLNGLMVNVAAGLLSIPFIFIGYELIKSACTSRINQALLSHLNLEIKYIMKDVIKDIQAIIPLKNEDIEEYLAVQKHIVKERFLPSGVNIPSISQHKTTIDKLIYNNKQINVLPNDQLHALLSVSKEMGQFISLFNRSKIAEKEKQLDCIYNLMKCIKVWLDAIDYDPEKDNHDLDIIEN